MTVWQFRCLVSTCYGLTTGLAAMLPIMIGWVARKVCADGSLHGELSARATGIRLPSRLMHLCESLRVFLTTRCCRLGWMRSIL